jgi:ABC-type nitrate/sulfonate/bicarbonate transport system substrate-binding protein
MNPIKVALDWTPNINHIGLIVAKELGFYAAEGIQAELLNPLDDQYFLTPGKKLELGLADFSLAPFETVISLNNKKNKVDALAVYAILQEDLSCVVSLRSSDLTQMKHLNGKIYASYKARYEDHIIQEMVKKDGGTGEIQLSYPEKLGIWNTLLTGKADATWIFDNWEGVEAETKNIELHKFYLEDYGIPYGYSPVIFAKKHLLDENQELYRRFVQATKKGYQYAALHQAESVNILRPYLPVRDQENIDLPRSLKITSSYFGENADYGAMKPERISAFLQWLVDHSLEHERILSQDLFTNALLNEEK